MATERTEVAAAGFRLALTPNQIRQVEGELGTSIREVLVLLVTPEHRDADVGVTMVMM